MTDGSINWLKLLVLCKEVSVSLTQRAEKANDEVLNANMRGNLTSQAAQQVYWTKNRFFDGKDGYLSQCTLKILSLDCPDASGPNQVAHSILLRLAPLPI